MSNLFDMGRLEPRLVLSQKTGPGRQRSRDNVVARSFVGFVLAKWDGPGSTSIRRRTRAAVAAALTIVGPRRGANSVPLPHR